MTIAVAGLITATLLDIAWILTGRAAVRRLEQTYSRKVAWQAGAAWFTLILVWSAAGDLFSGPHLSHPIAGQFKATILTSLTARLLCRWLNPIRPGLFPGTGDLPLPPLRDDPNLTTDPRTTAPDGDRRD